VTESILHECGLGVIRLKKPLGWYKEKYGSYLWGLKKMYLLMEKMHNRGQDGAGLGCVKLNTPPGFPYMERIRNNQSSPWMNLIKEVEESYAALKFEKPEIVEDEQALTQFFPFAGELLMGHLRYGTHGDNTLNACHPFIRANNWKTKSLMVAGNFNLTNSEELLRKLVDLGQHPRQNADTVTVMERIGHFLDEENQFLLQQYLQSGLSIKEAFKRISEELDLQKILTYSAKHWDGGYVMGGFTGNGDAFVLRDPNGIRPAWFYENEEVLVMASERPAICTVFNIPYADIQELDPGKALVIKRGGQVSLQSFTDSRPKTACSFERIYFSRGNDPEIYAERKKLGRLVVPGILKSIDQNLENAVFSYIPNTAETAFLGMMKGLESHLNRKKTELLKIEGPDISEERLEQILNLRPRVEKAVIKDVKLRTFISDDAGRDELVAHVYDITYGILKPDQDTLVCIDDSIVRGTTLKQSIVKILSRLRPKKIVIVSSAPQIRYPDCYGIDMSQIGKFVAFQAAIELLKEGTNSSIPEQVYQLCKDAESNSKLESENFVKKIYEPFSEEEVSNKIAELLTPEGLTCSFEIVFLPLASLREAIPNHTGDWYFSGNYPTPGGNKVVNRAYMNWFEGKSGRSYA